MNRSRLDRLLKRYTDGKCDPEEAKIVENWLNSDWKGNDEWDRMDDSSRQKLLSYLYDEVQQSISLKGRENAICVNRNAVLTNWKLVSSIAAMLLLVCGMYITWPTLIDLIDPVSYKQVSVLPGKMKKLVLADGTTLWLNSGSSLKYPEQFNTRSREVYLQGEAYFEVAHNPSAPFIVHTGNLKTRVIGTVFNVMAYADRKDVKVFLLSGKVEVSKEEAGQERSLTLLPKQLVTYTKDVGSLVKTNEDNIAQYSGWKQGKLVFDNTPMLEVLDRLSISYNMRLELKNENLEKCKLTGVFSVNQPLEEIMKSISISIGGKYSKISGRIILEGEGCVR